jgi:uncharacterized repeat protein (TIGR01451 family)
MSCPSHGTSNTFFATECNWWAAVRLKLLILALTALSLPVAAQVQGRYSNIAVNKTVDIVQPVPGGPVEFTIEVTNYGDYGAEGVLVRDSIEAPLRIPEGRAASPGKGYYDPESGEWEVGSLRVGESVLLVIPAIIVGDDLPACIVNTAEFDHPQDTTSRNNRSSMAVRWREGADCADISTGVSVTAGHSDFLLDGSCDKVRPYRGTVTLTNRGADAARGIDVQLIQDPVIGPNLRFEDDDCLAATAGGCRIDTMPAGETRRLSFVSDEFRNDKAREQSFSVQVATESIDYDTSNNNPSLAITVKAFSRCDSPYDIGLPDDVVPGGGGGGGGGCFIATAAYGSYLHPHVQVLRDWRDDVLLSTAPGRRFVDAYYRHSPPVADYIADRPWLQSLIRLGLLPLIMVLSWPTPLNVVLLLVLPSIVLAGRRILFAGEGAA